MSSQGKTTPTVGEHCFNLFYLLKSDFTNALWILRLTGKTVVSISDQSYCQTSWCRWCSGRPCSHAWRVRSAGGSAHNAQAVLVLDVWLPTLTDWESLCGMTVFNREIQPLLVVCMMEGDVVWLFEVQAGCCFIDAPYVAVNLVEDAFLPHWKVHMLTVLEDSPQVAVVEIAGYEDVLFTDILKYDTVWEPGLDNKSISFSDLNQCQCCQSESVESECRKFRKASSWTLPMSRSASPLNIMDLYI